MNSSCHYKKIDVTDLNLGDTTFNLRPLNNENPSAELIESIREFGLLHPPLVQKQTQGYYHILSGRKRIQAALDLLVPGELFCLVAPRHAPPLRVYSLLLHHALIGGKLSIIEQAIFFKKALCVLSENEIIPLLKPLGYKQHQYKIRELLDLLSLNELVIASLHSGIIHPKNARKMLRLQPDDQQEIIRFIDHFHMGGSKQQQLIDFSIELIMRRNQSLKEILNDWSNKQQTDTQLNQPQQAANLLNFLHEQCFSKIGEAEKEFKRQLSSLGLPDNVHVDHTLSFEDNGVTASFSFNHLNAFKKVWPKIKNIMAGQGESG